MDLIRYFKDRRGEQARMANLLEVAQPTVSNWARKSRLPQPKHCLLIETATKGQVTRKDLRPDDWRDIWPELATPEDDEKKPASAGLDLAGGQGLSGPA